jgi:hypothetical protein
MILVNVNCKAGAKRRSHKGGEEFQVSYSFMVDISITLEQLLAQAKKEGDNVCQHRGFECIEGKIKEIVPVI